MASIASNSPARRDQHLAGAMLQHLEVADRYGRLRMRLLEKVEP